MPSDSAARAVLLLQQQQQQQQQQHHHHQQQQPEPAPVFGLTAAGMQQPLQPLDSAYASQWGSRPTSALASGAVSHSASPTKLRWEAQQHRLDSCYQSCVQSASQSKSNSAFNSRPVSPTRGRARASDSTPSAGQSRRMSRAASPDRRREASPYAVVLPRGQVRLLDETAASALCRQSLEEELHSAAGWLQRLDWTSARSFEAASEEAAVMEEEFRSRYTREPPTAADAPEDENLIVLADTLLSMVETAWTDEDEAENEMKIGGRPMQVHQRSSKPKKEDAIYNVRYKTLPCLHWQKSRACPAGDHCHFAHGPQELRQPQKHPKFKTQICQNFRKTGRCQFGSRCFFKHSL